MSAPRFRAFAAIAPGLEEALHRELSDLGLRPEVQPGGVAFTTDTAGLTQAHLHGRTASRVTVEVTRTRARTLDEVAKNVRTGPFSRYVVPGQRIEVKATSRGSRLRNTNALAQKVDHAIRDALRGPRKPGPRPPREPAKFFVHAAGDVVRVSADASGELLHRRGWRQASARAPIRENLAAAILWLSDWAPGEPLVDPMCGSGTFVIEAATIAMGKAPGANRSFAFEHWPGVEHKVVAAQRRDAGSLRVLDRDARIAGSDRDAGAVKAAGDNARRAGVHRRIQLSQAAITDIDPVGPPGLLVTNPPYGQRVGSGSFGWLANELRRWAGWRVALVVPPGAKRVLRPLGMDEVASFKNGGIPVRLMVGRMGGA